MEERREEKVKTRGGMPPSPHNTNEFILADHADEATRRLGQYLQYLLILTYGLENSILEPPFLAEDDLKM